MRSDSYLLNVPVAPGLGSALPIGDLTNITVQLVGAWTGTVLIEVSCDGTNYETVDVAKTAKGITVFPVGGTFKSVRVNTTSQTAPAGFAAILMGRNVRTDQ